jgi:hypothetical protein
MRINRNLRAIGGLVILAGFVLVSHLLAGSFRPIKIETAVRSIHGSFAAPLANNGTFDIRGFYEGEDAAAIGWDTTAACTLFNAANQIAWDAHLCFVSDTSDAPINDTLRVIAASIFNGTVTDPDTELVVMPSTDAYDTFTETDSSWIGDIIIERVSIADSARSSNVFLARYWHNNESDFTVKGINVDHFSHGTDNGFDFLILHHKASGWSYNATGITAGDFPDSIATKIADQTATFDNVAAIKGAGWYRNDLSTAINADTNEGIVLRVITTVNNAGGLNYDLKIEE